MPTLFIEKTISKNYSEFETIIFYSESKSANIPFKENIISKSAFASGTVLLKQLAYKIY